MINEVYPIQVSGSLPYARLTVYIQEYTENLRIQERPLVLVCPGGGYSYTSDREAETIALQFLAMGYHAAVLRYSCAPAVFPTALLELASCMALIRKNAEKWHVDSDKIIVQGCSAGGHLAASLGMFWNRDFVAEGLSLSSEDSELFRPNAMLLCYPVITSGEFAHRGSFECVTGKTEAEQKVGACDELLALLSLENQVTKDTPRTFVWHTFTDQAVPVENSLMLVSALRRENIPTEFHMYPVGWHGLGLANRLTDIPGGGAIQEECQSWIGLAHSWIEHLWGDL